MKLPSTSSADAAVDVAAEDVESLLRLVLVSGVGPRLRQALVARFGSPVAVLNAREDELRSVEGIGGKLASAIVRAQHEIDVSAELALCRAHGVTILTQSHTDYPRLLREIHDPPGVLFVRGALKPQDALSMAIVGARHATHYGLSQAEKLASGLARAGLTITSGLARGIDAAAHRGALAAGRRTLAVLANGLAEIYPPEHAALATEVAASGALLSEAPMRVVPMKGAFPQRNRLISGMTLGVIVVEAAARSGALITARHAMEQGREVFAVPGRVDNLMSRGCHRLIRDGAKLVETVDDVLEELGPLVEAAPAANGQTVHHPAELSLNEMEQLILAAVRTDPTPIDELVTTTGVPPAQVLATLSALEMRRLIRRLSGNLVVRR